MRLSTRSLVSFALVGVGILIIGQGALWYSMAPTKTLPARDAESDADNQSSLIPHRHGPFDTQSDVPDGSHVLVPEWCPVEGIVLALPSSRQRDSDYLRLIGDIVASVLTHTSAHVHLIIERDDIGAREQFASLLSQRGLSEARATVIDAASMDSSWIRDYGPIYVRSAKSDELLAVDLGYRDYRLGLDTVHDTPGIPATRPADDLIPIYLATVLGVKTIHPGLLLNGGDVYGDGKDSVFMSEDAIIMNSGDLAFVRNVAAQFLGAENVHVLRSLPGPTVKHIDMFFKLVNPHTCLLGAYRSPVGHDQLAVLQRDAGRVLDLNEARLTELGYRVIRVPMPDISRTSRLAFLRSSLPADLLNQWIVTESVSTDALTTEFEASLERDFVYAYRSYLNSVLVSTSGASVDGQANRRQSLLLVPRYSLPDQDNLEADLATIYRMVYGEPLNIVFVDTEFLAYSNGSLHCLTSTIPDRSPRRSSCN